MKLQLQLKMRNQKMMIGLDSFTHLLHSNKIIADDDDSDDDDDNNKYKNTHNLCLTQLIRFGTGILIELKQFKDIRNVIDFS